MIGNTIKELVADPSASLVPATDVLERVLRSQISNSRPRGG